MSNQKPEIVSIEELQPPLYTVTLRDKISGKTSKSRMNIFMLNQLKASLGLPLEPL